MPIQDLNDIIKKIEDHKSQIAEQRDALRKIYDELADYLESFDTGIEGLNEGVRCICNAVDSISEVV